MQPGLLPTRLSQPFSGTGVASTIAQGQTTIQATSGSVSGSTTLTVNTKQTFTPVSDLIEPRQSHDATLLADGRVLITGGGNVTTLLSSAELYDPLTKTFGWAGSMKISRMFHTATLLQNGKVLIAGGETWIAQMGVPVSSAELYDPATSTFTYTGSLTAGTRFSHTATLLNNGKVLIMGGSVNGTVARTAELYDPATGTFSVTGPPLSPRGRAGHVAKLLGDGTVLIAGGADDTGKLVPSAEIYDPTTGTFSAAGNMVVPRSWAASGLLNSGTVLLAGGVLNSTVTSAAETYAPGPKTFSSVTDLAAIREQHSGTTLPDGSVLIVAGFDPNTTTELATAELYDPSSQAFIGAGSMWTARSSHTATLLTDGTVLFAGGNVPTGETGSAELYAPPLPPPASVQILPAITSLVLGQSQQFKAFDDQGHQRFDVTWTLSDNNIATLSLGPSPTLTTLAAGDEVLTANVEGITAQVNIIIAPSTLQITPSVVNMQVGESRNFTVVDNLGHPSGDVAWSVSDTSLASVTSGNNTTLTANAFGTITLSASVEGVTAEAQVTIWAAGAIPSGTELWSVPSSAGYAPLQVVQAMPMNEGPDVYSVQVSNDGAHSIVQALTREGQHLWNKLLPILNDNNVPDGAGGLVLTENNTCFPNQTDPMTIVGLSAKGEITWQLPAAGVQGPNNTIVYCYPAGARPEFAVRGDGTVVIDAMTNSGVPPLTLVKDGQLTSIIISSSTDTQPDGTTFAEFSPMGPPIVGSDDSIYVEYEVRQIAANPRRITSAILYLLRIDSNNSRSDTPLSSTSEDVNLLPGRVIPDGEGGVVATWTVAPSNPPAWSPSNAPHPYKAVRVVGGSPGAPYDLPFTPQSTSAGNYPTLVLGENGTAFASASSTKTDGTNVDTTKVASFDVGSGSATWTYETPGQNSVSIMAATSDGGLATTTSTGVRRFDASGNSSITGAATTANQSWYGKWFTKTTNAIAQILQDPLDLAASFWAVPGGNQSKNGMAIKQVMNSDTPTDEKQLPNLGAPSCNPFLPQVPPNPTCGNINIIELLTDKSPDFIFQNYIQTYLPGSIDSTTQQPNNEEMIFSVAGGGPINVTGVNQKLTIKLRGLSGHLQDPFSVLTERFDPTNHVISAVTLKGHPLAGWRYWRVYSIGTNDVVIETGAYDQPGPGLKNFAGFYIAQGTVSRGWLHYLRFIQNQIQAQQAGNLLGAPGGIPIRGNGTDPNILLNGYWDYWGDFTNYLLNNICLSTSCN